MGYGQLSRKRKTQAIQTAAIEKCRADKEALSKQGDMPAYGMLFTFIVSLCSCSIASFFFAYKWFACLNYLIRKRLFSACSLTVIWSILFAVGIGSILFESFWMLMSAWVGHAALVVYLLLQLRKCRIYSDQTSWQQKIAFAEICLLLLGWAIFIVLQETEIIWCRRETLLVCALVFVVIETCLIQRMFNVAVCEAMGSRDLWNLKKSDDLQKLRTYFVWFAICLSVALFFWDIADTVLRFIGKFRVYHGLYLSGEFQMWLFFEEYCPHASWQMCLWCAALIIAKMPLGFVSRFDENMKVSIKAFFARLFPNVTPECDK